MLCRLALPSLPMPCTARPPVGSGHILTAIHAAITVGIAAAIGVLAVIRARAMALVLGRSALCAVLSMPSVLSRTRLLAVGLMLAMVLRGRLGRLSSRGNREREPHRSDEKRLHVMIS